MYVTSTSILKEGIYKYNNYRPHYALKGKTPSEIWKYLLLQSKQY